MEVNKKALNSLIVGIQEAQDKIEDVVSYIVYHELDDDSCYMDIGAKLTDARNILVDVLGGK